METLTHPAQKTIATDTKIIEVVLKTPCAEFNITFDVGLIEREGANEGAGDGATEGAGDGATEGREVGTAVGALVGEVGESVGMLVGVGVGTKMIAALSQM